MHIVSNENLCPIYPSIKLHFFSPFLLTIELFWPWSLSLSISSIIWLHNKSNTTTTTTKLTDEKYPISFDFSPGTYTYTYPYMCMIFMGKYLDEKKEKAYTYRRWVRIRHSKTMSVDCLLLSSSVSSRCNEAFHLFIDGNGDGVVFFFLRTFLFFRMCCLYILFFRDVYQSIIFDKFITMLLESERILIIHKYLRATERKRRREREKHE